MLKIILFISFSLLVSTTLFAQSPILTGTLKDGDSKLPLAGATVKIVSPTDSSSVITNNRGVFEFNNLIIGTTYMLSATYSGFEVIRRQIIYSDSLKPLGDIVLNKEAKELTGVTVVGTPAPVRQKADTVEMNANQFKVNPDANTEDLVKKHPALPWKAVW